MLLCSACHGLSISACICCSPSIFNHIPLLALLIDTRSTQMAAVESDVTITVATM